MYLPQATSRPPSIGAQSDFFLCSNRGQESWFAPSVVAFGTVVGPLLALSHIFRQSAASKPDLTSAGSGQEHPHEALELGAGYRNPAPWKVWPYLLYKKSYSGFNVRNWIVYICMYVPAAGHISPSIDRSPVELLPMQQPWPGELVCALSCRFWHCGGCSPCSTSHFSSECRVEAGPNLGRIGPGAPSRGVGAWGWI